MQDTKTMTIEELQAEAKARITRALIGPELTTVETLVESARASFFARLELAIGSTLYSSLLADFNNAITGLVLEIQLGRESNEALLSKLHSLQHQVNEQTNERTNKESDSSS